jgi:hypothetical protein
MAKIIPAVGSSWGIFKASQGVRMGDSNHIKGQEKSGNIQLIVRQKALLCSWACLEEQKQK